MEDDGVIGRPGSLRAIELRPDFFIERFHIDRVIPGRARFGVRLSRQKDYQNGENSHPGGMRIVDGAQFVSDIWGGKVPAQVLDTDVAKGGCMRDRKG